MHLSTPSLTAKGSITTENKRLVEHVSHAEGKARLKVVYLILLFSTQYRWIRFFKYFWIQGRSFKVVIYLLHHERKEPELFKKLGGKNRFYLSKFSKSILEWMEKTGEDKIRELTTTDYSKLSGYKDSFMIPTIWPATLKNCFDDNAHVIQWYEILSCSRSR